MRSELVYLQEVLGVQSWVSPLSRTAAAPVAVETPLLGAQFQAEWPEEAVLFARKVFQAAHVAFTENALDAKNILAFAEPLGRFEREGRVYWNLGNLDSLTKGDASEIQKSKREVWNLLKVLKEELSV